MPYPMGEPVRAKETVLKYLEQYGVQIGEPFTIDSERWSRAYIPLVREVSGEKLTYALQSFGNDIFIEKDIVETACKALDVPPMRD